MPMFILDENAFPEINAIEVNEVDVFINFWANLYNDHFGDRCEYYRNINIGGNLTVQNIQALYKYKSSRTHQERLNQLENHQVSINNFRNTLQDHPIDEMIQQVFNQLFTSGCHVMKIFILHMAKPFEYPIVDVFAFKAAEELWNIIPPASTRNLNGRFLADYYVPFKECFFVLAANLQIGQEHNLENLKKLKQIDNALMAFGQFLEKYPNIRPVNDAAN